MFIVMYVGITISVTQSAGAYMSSSMYMPMLIEVGTIRQGPPWQPCALTSESGTSERPRCMLPDCREPM